MNNLHLELILGGMRSGKSRIAQQRCASQNKQVVYIATATAGDTEMRDRIERHQCDRPNHWRTIEEPIHLAKTLIEHADVNSCLLVDCLTLWVTNLICNDDAALLESEIKLLLTKIKQLRGTIILVSNETGLGIIPADPISRRFIDICGRLHQDLAQLSDTVIYTVAGIPQFLKSPVE